LLEKLNDIALSGSCNRQGEAAGQQMSSAVQWGDVLWSMLCFHCIVGCDAVLYMWNLRLLEWCCNIF